MIAQYQFDKLRSRLSERIDGYCSISNKKASMHLFKHNEKWYKVSTKVERVSLVIMYLSLNTLAKFISKSLLLALISKCHRFMPLKYMRR